MISLRPSKSARWVGVLLALVLMAAASGLVIQGQTSPGSRIRFYCDGHQADKQKRS